MFPTLLVLQREVFVYLLTFVQFKSFFIMFGVRGRNGALQQEAYGRRHNKEFAKHKVSRASAASCGLMRARRGRNLLVFVSKGEPTEAWQ